MSCCDVLCQLATPPVTRRTWPAGRVCCPDQSLKTRFRNTSTACAAASRALRLPSIVAPVAVQWVLAKVPTSVDAMALPSRRSR